MAKIYYEAVKSGKRTLDSVPKRWRDAVAAMLEADKKNDQEG
ncbi:CD1375 family protein [uncultured Senegalimassilia sp.]|nr:CD1375 family protein [uncultured Senegalimassilia sp.]